jgi:predicted RND superfamily exporter protein
LGKPNPISVFFAIFSPYIFSVFATVFFALQLPKAQMNNNMTAFLPEDNSARITTDHLDAEYGEEISILVA